MNLRENRIYRCAIDLHVPRAARKTLLEALRDEPFALRHHVEWDSLQASVRAGRLRVHYMQDRPWVGFESDIALLSVRLPHTLVRGVSIVETQDEEGRTIAVRAEKLVGRRGETVRIPLRPRPQGDEFLVDDASDDLDAIREHWTSYPRWVQNALRRRYAVARSWPTDDDPLGS